MINETPAERVLLQTNATWLDRTIGAVAISLAVLLVAFVFTLARTSLTKSQATPLGVWILLAVSLGLTVFFFVAGIRLTFQAPNRHGSLFAPWVWFTITGFLLVLAAVLGIFGLREASLEGGRGFVAALLLALLSYGAGAHFRHKARRRRSE